MIVTKISNLSEIVDDNKFVESSGTVLNKEITTVRNWGQSCGLRWTNYKISAGYKCQGNYYCENNSCSYFTLASLSSDIEIKRNLYHFREQNGFKVCEYCEEEMTLNPCNSKLIILKTKSRTLVYHTKGHLCEKKKTSTWKLPTDVEVDYDKHENMTPKEMENDNILHMLEQNIGRSEIIDKMSKIVSGGQSGSIRKAKVLRKESREIEIEII